MAAADHRSGPPDPFIGGTFGPYRFSRRLGAGGMGVVYEAEDTRLGRAVAVKVLTADLSGDADVLRRFEHEARATAKLNHPNVITVHEFAHESGLHFLVMELMPGGSVHELVRRRPGLGWGEATAVIAGACRGLAAAHAAGLIHRDVKPANLLLAADNTVKIADFGLARAVHRSTSGLTATGNILGTPAFMSPEQCRAEPLEPRSDLYSLGATYYYLLTGQYPYPVGNPMQVMFSHCSAPVPDPRAVNPDVPAECAAVVTRAMAKRRGDRYRDAAAMLADLDAILSATLILPGPAAAGPGVSLTPVPPADTMPALTPPTVKRRRPAAVWGSLAGVALLSAVVIGYAVSRGKPPTEGTSPTEPATASTVKAGPSKPLTLVKRKTLAGHTKEVRTTRFSPDGKWLATAGSDQQARIWAMPAGTEHRVLGGHRKQAYAASFSPDGETVATGDEQSVHLWDVQTGAKLGSAPDEGPITIFDVAFSPDGTRVAGARGYVGLEIWDRPGRAKLKTRHVIPLQNDLAVLVQFAADNSAVDVVTFDRNFQRFDPDTGRELARFVNGRTVRGAAVTGPRGDLVALGLNAGYALWRPVTGEKPTIFSEDAENVFCVAFSPDGDTVLYARGHHGDFRLRHLPTGREATFRAASPLRTATFSPDGLTLVTGGITGGDVTVWDVREAE